MSPDTHLFLLEHGGPMVLLLLLGGSMGSFLNVVIDRGSRGGSREIHRAARVARPAAVISLSAAARL